ncbi:MAG: hypothetical protein JWP75_3296, partial [Frondihabitans sp.]|nr:hypothetical protein [Frondihabitans sp.]
MTSEDSRAIGVSYVMPVLNE